MKAEIIPPQPILDPRLVQVTMTWSEAVNLRGLLGKRQCTLVEGALWDALGNAGVPKA